MIKDTGMTQEEEGRAKELAEWVPSKWWKFKNLMFCLWLGFVTLVWFIFLGSLLFGFVQWILGIK